MQVTRHLQAGYGINLHTRNARDCLEQLKSVGVPEQTRLAYVWRVMDANELTIIWIATRR